MYRFHVCACTHTERASLKPTRAEPLVVVLQFKSLVGTLLEDGLASLPNITSAHGHLLSPLLVVPLRRYTRVTLTRAIHLHASCLDHPMCPSNRFSCAVPHRPCPLTSQSSRIIPHYTPALTEGGSHLRHFPLSR